MLFLIVKFQSLVPHNALVALILLLLFAAGPAHTMDLFWQSPNADFNEMAEEVQRLIEAEKSAEIISLCNDALESLGDIEPLPPSATPQERSKFQSQCDYVYYFADAAFWEVYDSEYESAAIPYGEKAISAAEISLRSDLQTGYIENKWVLELAYAVGYLHSQSNDVTKAIATYDQAIAYAESIGLESLDTEARWHLGSIYTGLSNELDKLSFLNPRRYTADAVFESGVDYLIDGVSSQVDDPEFVNEVLPAVLEYEIGQVEDDPEALHSRLKEYITRLEKQDHPSLSQSLIILYGYQAAWEFNYGSMQAAITWNGKLLEKERSHEEPYAFSLLYSLSDQAYYYTVSGDVSAAKGILVEMKDLLPQINDADMVRSSRGWVAGVEAELYFMSKNAAMVMNKYSEIINDPSLHPENYYHFWNSLNALTNCISVEDEPEAAVRLLQRFDALLCESDNVDLAEEDKLLARCYFELSKAEVHGLYWFDDEFANGSISHVPKSLSKSGITDLLVWVEHAYLKGYRADVERLTTEILRRGVSEDYIDSLFWIYTYGS